MHLAQIRKNGAITVTGQRRRSNGENIEYGN
jgi:hypothetical protein